jgi:hypothetical protein
MLKTIGRTHAEIAGPKENRLSRDIASEKSVRMEFSRYSNPKTRGRAFLTESGQLRTKKLQIVQDELKVTKSEIGISPFRPKLKGQLSMRRNYPETDPDYELGVRNMPEMKEVSIQ